MAFAQEELVNPYKQISGVDNLSILALDGNNYIEMSLNNLNCRKLEEIVVNKDNIYKHSENTSQNSVLNNIFQRQCKKNDSLDKQIFDSSYGNNIMTSVGLFCSTIQAEQIEKLFKGSSLEDLDQEMVTVFTSECVDASAGLKISDEFPTDNQQKNTSPVIKLAAPLPIDEGNYIKNTNKTYLYDYMVKLYKFVVSIAGIIVVGELVLGGYIIALAAGDSGKIENAKKRVIQSLEGLGLLFVTAIILNTINPQAYNFDATIYEIENSIIDIEAINRVKEPALAMVDPPPGETGTNGALDIANLKPIGKGADKKYYKDGNFYLRADAADKWLEFMEFVKTSGKKVTVTSAYRNYQHQSDLYKSLGKYAAPPKNSSHGWGIAVDMQELFAKSTTEKERREKIKSIFYSETYDWITKNAANYGWYNPNRLKDNYKDPNYTNSTTGVDEPWHFEFCPGQSSCP